jgi:hypothetical protein
MAERSLEQKLHDANVAVRQARREVGRVIQQRDEANSQVCVRRAKLDQAEAHAAKLQAEFEAKAEANPFLQEPGTPLFGIGEVGPELALEQDGPPLPDFPPLPE